MDSESTPLTPKRKREPEEDTASPKKRKLKIISQNTPSPKQLEVEKVPLFPSLVTDSPLTAESKYFLPAKILLAETEYSQCAKECLKHSDQEDYLKKHKRKNPVFSPEARNLFKGLPNNYPFRIIKFNEQHFYQNDTLFDPYAKFLIKGKEKTNLELMKEGHAPLIQRGNKLYRVELHHLMQKQKDTETKDYPIVEMSSKCHMGFEDRMVLEVDAAKEEMRIVHHSLTKQEAEKLCKPHQIIVANVIHFLKEEKSFINRGDFNRLREAYWRFRAKEIEAGNYVKKEDLPLFISPVKLFTSPPPAKQIKKDKKEIVTEKEIPLSSPVTSPDFCADSSAGEINEDILMDKENDQSPLGDLFESMTPFKFLTGFSPTSIPVKLKESNTKNPLKVRDLNTIKKELFPN